MKAKSAVAACAAIMSLALSAAIVYPEICSQLDAAASRVLPFDECRGFCDGFVRDGQEIVCDNGADATGRRGALWRVELKQTIAEPFTVTAESLAIKAEGVPSCDYSVYLDVVYADDTRLYGQNAPFMRDPTIGWQRKTVLVMPEKPVKFFVCHLLFRNAAGKVRFRAPVVRRHEMDSAAFYDSCRIDLSRRADLKAPGFMVRDVTAGRGFASIENGGKAESLSLDAKTERIGDATMFDVTVNELSGRDRAVTLVYAVPIEGTGPLVWNEDPRTAMPVESGQNGQCKSTIRHAIGEGEMTRWPFGAVTAGGKGTALGIDCTAPAFFRVVAHARLRQIFIAFDLGFAKEHPAAHFRFVRFGFPAKHGFRGALATYQALFPELFKVRIKEHGLWMAFWKISTVAGWEDFGFKIKEGDHEPDWDDAHGILTFRYTEPSTWWMKMPKGTDKFSFADCVVEADRLGANGDALAKVWRYAAMRDESGRVLGSVQDTPWCKGAVWNLCSLPALPNGEYRYKFRCHMEAALWRQDVP